VNHLNRFVAIIKLALACTAYPLSGYASQTTSSAVDPGTRGNFPVSTSAETDKAAFASKVDQYVSATMVLQSLPGISIAVVKDGQLVYAKGYGVANRDQNIPVTSETLFNLASVSKAFTAVAAMKLVEQGKLDLTAPIQNYVPEFPVKEWPINSKDLLTHQAGIRHYKGNEAISAAHYDDVISALEIFKDDPLLHKPGTKAFYSSYGYNLVGAVIERASGKPFIDYVQDEILRPSGAKNVRVHDGRIDVQVQASGYLKGKNGIVDAPTFNATNKIPAGGFVASAADVGHFAASLLNGQLITTETLNQMMQPPLLADGKKSWFGIGWMLRFWGKTPIITILAGQPGYTSLIYIIPERKFAAVLLTNISGPNLNELLYRIRDEVLGAQN